jgi:hypothetical protein
MKFQEIKSALLEGQQFGNDTANWFTINRPSTNRPSERVFWIVIGERYLCCKNINSAARRISQLIKRGY